MAGPPMGPFAMPMMNDFVPKAIRPWIYLIFAFCFQLSAGVYAGAMPQMMGDMCLMREDVMMITLSGVVGVNMMFPFLFRFKFRFTNKFMLTTAALSIATCNLLSMTTENVVLLCAINFVSNCFKLWGTFECISNIQLWMTPKRDFSIFFPLLYCIVLGNMSLSPWVTTQLTYIFQDWHVMHWTMAGVMFTIAMLVQILTHPFRFMQPLPLKSMDWGGLALWSALMLEIIFVFNYGEYYKWNDSPVWRIGVFAIPITLYACVRRMRKIRHPYIAKEAWQHRHLVHLLVLFAIVDMMDASPKVLQSAFTGSLLHFGTMTTSVFNLVEWIGSICGCMFVLWWMKGLKFKFTYLLTIGYIILLSYQVQMYFLIAPGLNIEAFYLPIFCRAFGVAIFFAALTIYLEEIMPFQHFFMGLTMIGLIRNGVGGSIGSAIFSYAMRYSVADNFARALPYVPEQVLMNTIRQLYGYTCIVGVVVLLVFLLFDIQTVRRTFKRMPHWLSVERVFKRTMEREPAD